MESFVERARAEFILLQCGTDGIAGGPITHMAHRSVAHRHATGSLGALAETHCNGRLLGPGGGGCHLANLANAWCAVVEAMLDADDSSWLQPRPVYAARIPFPAPMCPPFLQWATHGLTVEPARHVSGLAATFLDLHHPAQEMTGSRRSTASLRRIIRTTVPAAISALRAAGPAAGCGTQMNTGFPMQVSKFMSIPEDVFENTSDEMSAVIASVLDDDDLDQPATLASVREAILARVKTVTIPLNRFSSDDWQALHDEIDALIEEYDADALAVRFLRPWASEPLQRLIEAGLDELGDPTLGTLYETMQGGLLAHLIGQGEVDDDEAQTVVAELQNLIGRHGHDALAENFLGAL